MTSLPSKAFAACWRNLKLVLSNADSPSPTPVLLSEAEWLELRRSHEARVSAWTAPHQQRAARGEGNPVNDFLFKYYRHRPSWLRRWHPGPDVVLLGDTAKEFLRWSEYRESGGGAAGPEPVEGVSLDLAALTPKRRESIAWIHNLLQFTRDRPPVFGCFGLHEWAMVYRQTPDQVRHNQWPLRFAPDELARIVKAQPVRCSHFDAFRFFTDEAKPLNRQQPTRATVTDFEQRGCLHANMDLYKWAFKLAPFTPAELVADCFSLAHDIRQIDMRASPYDFAKLGYASIKIETPEGRADYERHQREFSDRSQPLRRRLIALCARLLAG